MITRKLNSQSYSFRHDRTTLRRDEYDWLLRLREIVADNA